MNQGTAKGKLNWNGQKKRDTIHLICLLLISPQQAIVEHDQYNIHLHNEVHNDYKELFLHSSNSKIK